MCVYTKKFIAFHIYHNYCWCNVWYKLTPNYLVVGTTMLIFKFVFPLCLWFIRLLDSLCAGSKESVIPNFISIKQYSLYFNFKHKHSKTVLWVLITNFRHFYNIIYKITLFFRKGSRFLNQKFCKNIINLT